MVYVLWFWLYIPFFKNLQYKSFSSASASRSSLVFVLHSEDWMCVQQED